MRRHHLDNDDAFENGILKDGRSFRTSLTMMDALDPVQQSVRRSHLKVLDGEGNTQFHKPGWRIPEDDALLRARDAATEEYLRDLTSAWRGGDAELDHARRRRKTSYDPRGRLRGTSEVEEEDGQTADAIARNYDAAVEQYHRILDNAWRHPAAAASPCRPSGSSTRASSDQRGALPDAWERAHAGHFDQHDATRVCSYCSGAGRDEDGATCTVCGGTGYETSAEQIEHNASTHTESASPRRDHRSIQQMMSDHQQHMAQLYEAADAERCDAWRRR
jgi:hypothetical protein